MIFFLNAYFQVLQCLASFASQAIYEGWERPDQVLTSLPAHLSPDVSQHLTGILVQALSEWRSHAIANQVSPPRLVNFSCQVCTKSPIDNVAGTNTTASCLLHLQVTCVFQLYSFVKICFEKTLIFNNFLSFLKKYVCSAPAK